MEPRDHRELVQADAQYVTELEAEGGIDIVFWAGNTNRGELRNIRLTGNELEFEFFHRGEYGPLLYQLYRVAPSD